MIRRQPRSTRPDTAFPSPTLFRAAAAQLQHDRMFGRVTPEQPRPIAVQDRTRRDHLSVENRAPAEQAMEVPAVPVRPIHHGRSEEHTSELQSLMRITYAVFCLKKKKNKNTLTQRKQKNKSKP